MHTLVTERCQEQKGLKLALTDSSIIQLEKHVRSELVGIMFSFLHVSMAFGCRKQAGSENKNKKNTPEVPRRYTGVVRSNRNSMGSWASSRTF